MWRTCCLWLTLLLSGCDAAPSVTLHPAEAYPERLSAWGVVAARGDALVLGGEVLPYDLNTPLFTDYAHKLRTVWMPAGHEGRLVEDDVIELPEGTVLSKTFYYPRNPDEVLALNDDASGDFEGEGLDLARVRLIETRLLVRQADGWDTLAYLWDDAQKDAFLAIAGDIQRLPTTQGPMTYVVPTRDECASCHAWDQTAGGPQPIGIRVRHLAKDYVHYADGAAPQLARWVARGYLDRAPSTPTANALWDAAASDQLEHRARSYLDVNCGHCHNPVGPADTSGLMLTVDETVARRLGRCKPPIAAGRGSGGLRYSIVPGAPDESILVHRMNSTEPDVMMPELGRTTVHTEGVDLITAWIDGMSGSCAS
jgi:uncharacterized repeat protein (TIGR03806 family)